jgi:predicted RNA-binding protein YlxR (DUF448 family)
VSRAAHSPIRTCIGCGERALQRELRCVSIAPDGALRIVDRRRRMGRTGYLHDRLACWERFARRKGPVRSLRRSVDKGTRMALVQVLKATEPAVMMR